MKGKNEIGKDNLTGKEVSGTNRDVMVFVFFLFLSFIFWYLNSLGKVTEAEVRYPLKYINLPKERILIEELPIKLNLYLKGQGFSLLRIKLSGNKTPLLVDVSKVSYRRVPGSKNLNYYVITSGLTKSFTVQLRSGCDITSIKPDTLFFTLEKANLKSGTLAPDKNVADVTINNDLSDRKMPDEKRRESSL